ncbi:MAG: iron chelate uptake ABC transporter family permease subunit [bacterium]|nr:iron chelate uptake ABC transporter family permease subunit [bacterium]
MFDDFFVRAMIAGIGVALITAPLGCFIVWRRMAYFGDTISHSALLGVALGFLLQINISVAVFTIAALVSLSLLSLQKHVKLSSDSILGILSHSALASGLVVIAFMPGLRVDLTGYLFGDILAVSRIDIAIIYGGGLLVLLVLAWIWRPLLAETVSYDLARAEGLKPEFTRLVFMLLVALIVAIAMKIVGILLITALLIIPASTARRFAASPEMMAVGAMIAGVLSVIAGLYCSMSFDTPSGPSIVVAALMLFLVTSIVPLTKGAR